MKEIDKIALSHFTDLTNLVEQGNAHIRTVDLYNNSIEIYDDSEFPTHKNIGYTLTVDYVIHSNKKEDKKVKILVSKESPAKQTLIQRLHPFEVEFLDRSKCDIGVVRRELLNFEDEVVMLYGEFSNTEIQFLTNKNCTVIDVSNIFV